MQTIEVKYLPWTDTKPSRVKATASYAKESVTLTRHGSNAPVDSIEWCDLQEHINTIEDKAAMELARKLNWHPCEFIRGATKDGFVYVFANDARVKVQA